MPGVESLEVAGNGYLNIRLDRGAYGFAVLSGQKTLGSDRRKFGDKIIVEHTNINPNKAAHIGHLRNAVLGDTFVRMLRAAGGRSKSRTTSTTRACRWPTSWSGSISGEEGAGRGPARLIAAGRFDYYCWDLYARIGAYYTEHPEALKWRAETLHAIEAGEGVAGRARPHRRRRDRAGAPGDDAAARTSSTTCCRARARSCTSSSGPPRSSC